MTELLSPELISVESRRFGLAFLNWTVDLLQWFLLWFSIPQNSFLPCRPQIGGGRSIRRGLQIPATTELPRRAFLAWFQTCYRHEPAAGLLNHITTATCAAEGISLSTPPSAPTQDSAGRRSINWPIFIAPRNLNLSSLQAESAGAF